MIRTAFAMFTLTTLLVLGIGETDARSNAAGIRVTLSTKPERIRMGERVALTLEILDSSNTRLRQLPLVHERPIHLIITPADLSAMAHLHPISDNSGLFTTTHVFAAGGRYMIYADLQSPDGEPVVAPFTVDVQGDATPVRPLEQELSHGGQTSAGGIEAERVGPESIVPGDPVVLTFSLSDTRNGRPVHDLEPYLGTMAHVIIISADGQEFLHAHTMEDNGQAGGGDHGGHGMHMGHAGTSSGTGGSILKVHTSFPGSGLYRIWVQVQRQKKVITLPFVVKAKDEDATEE